MVKFHSEKISEHVTRIYGLAGEQMYLVEGAQKAALLDTGSGAGSLRRYVETLTDKPLTALLTHGHVDHAMGAPEFDTVSMIRIKYSLQGTTQGNGLTGADMPVRFSM